MATEELPAYTPQAIDDILPIYHPENSLDHVLTYKLRQTSPSTQTLTLSSPSASAYTTTATTAYDIISRATAGFMNRKPHVIISARQSDSSKIIAEGKFAIHSTGTTISYFGGREQTLQLQDSQAQLLRTTMGGKVVWWQPHPGNSEVLELTNEYEEMLARFVHKEQGCQRSETLSRRDSSGSTPSVVEGRRKSGKKEKDATEFEVGELHVVDALVGGQEAGSERRKEELREEVLCSALMVVERAKRRRANLSKSGPALKGPASWGWDGAPAGGAVGVLGP